MGVGKGGRWGRRRWRRGRGRRQGGGEGGGGEVWVRAGAAMAVGGGGSGGGCGGGAARQEAAAGRCTRCARSRPTWRRIPGGGRACRTARRPGGSPRATWRPGRRVRAGSPPRPMGCRPRRRRAAAPPRSQRARRGSTSRAARRTRRRPSRMGTRRRRRRRHHPTSAASAVQGGGDDSHACRVPKKVMPRGAVCACMTIAGGITFVSRHHSSECVAPKLGHTHCVVGPRACCAGSANSDQQ